MTLKKDGTPSKKVVSRKLTPVPKVSSTGITVETSYCRKCMKMKSFDQFFKATDTFLDSNGLMSVCKDCINDIWSKIYENEQSVEKTLLRVCRMLNVKYDEDALRQAQSHLAILIEKGSKSESIFGLYKAKLLTAQKTSLTNRNMNADFTFTEPTHKAQSLPIDDSNETAVYLSQFWGTNFIYDDYIYLENELADWKKTHKSDTKAEIMLLKELCYKGLEIRKARVEGKNPAGMVSELQNLMKTANVDPAKTSVAGSGKSQDTFSSFIKTIEENEPAEFFEDKDLFKDVDNIDWYFKKYLTRPLGNFLGVTKNFNVEQEEEEEDNFENIAFPSENIEKDL